MALLIFGLIIIFAARFLAQNPNTKHFTNPTRIVGLIIILLGILISCIVQIDAGEIGVQKLFGKIQNNVLYSGLHFINPLVNVEHLDIKTQNYTMSGITDEGTKSGDDAIKVLTADGLEVTIDLSVLYRVVPNDAPKLLQQTGIDYEDKIVRPLTRTRIRDNAVYYDAVSLYSTKRDEFQQRIYKTIERDFNARGLLLEQLLVRNITLPESVKQSIEQKINAEQDAQKMQFVLQKEQQEAQRKRIEAQGIADYQTIISQSLTDKQLQYERIKAQLEIAKSPNTKIIVMGNGNTPLIMDTQKWLNTFAQKFEMQKVELARVHGDYGFEVKDAYGQSVKIDNSPDYGGENFGVRPMQMLLMALAGCSGMDVISILKKQRQNVTDYKTIVHGEREHGVEPSLWKFIEMEFIIYGDVDEEKAKRAAELSVTKYCSVAETLRKAGATIKWTVKVKKV